MTGGFTHRVIALVDMDCFYCQVESRINPELRGKPVAVVQYNQWEGGGLIAVNYEAKAQGVHRGMRGSQAKEICPDINLVSVPMLRGKSDLTKYRDAGDEVAEIFSDYSDLVQRASIDEAYIDLTKTVQEKIESGISNFDENKLQSTYIVGYSSLKSNNEEEKQAGLKKWLKVINEGTPDSPDFHLTVGALIVEEMREKILLKTGFHCSAGIAHGKILAKLVAGLHKPKHQTILPQDGVPELYHLMPVYNIKSLGGKFGQCVTEKMSVKYMSDLYKYSLKELQQKFDEKSGLWLYNISRGIDLEPVTPRLVPDSIGCSKNFPGKGMLSTKEEVEHWIGELSDEIRERLCKDVKKNKRRAKLLTVSFYQRTSVSRSDALTSYDTKTIARTALELLKKFNEAPSSSNAWYPPIKFLGLSASKFAKEYVGINKFLKNKSNSDAGAAHEFQIAVSEENCSSAATCHVRGADVSEDVIPLKSGDKICERELLVDDINPRCSKSNDGESSQSERPSFFLSYLRNHIDEIVENKVDQPIEAIKQTPDETHPMKSEVGPSSKEIIASSSKCGNEAPEEKGRYCVSGEGENADGDFASGTKLCDECNEQIQIVDFFEHLDYHVAKKLEAEINGELPPSSTENRAGDDAQLKGIGSKRKRFERTNPGSKKVRSIKSFFSVVTK